MNRLCSILLPALLAGLFFLSACGRKETPKPKSEPPAPSMPKVLREADVMFKDGVVCIKATGAPFTGTLQDHWPSGKLRRETGVKNGQRHGPMKEWLENGRLHGTGQFVDNKPDGVFTEHTEDGFRRIETTYKLGRKVSLEAKRTAKMKTEVAALQAARDEADRTVWAPERESQVREKTFVKLWDDLRAAKHDWKPLEQFAFKSLRLGELGAVSRHDWGIERREMGEENTTLNPDDWRAMIKKWRAASIRVIETEWHQASFEPAKAGRPARSLFKVVAHVVDEARQTRHILRADLRVQWSPKPGVDGRFVAGQLALEGLTMLSRKGAVPLVTELVIDVLKDNPEVTPPPMPEPHNWGQLNPAILAVMDLNGDQLPEIISANANLIYWNQGKFKFEPKKLFPDGNGFPHYLVFGEFTGDAKLDFLTLNPAGEVEVLPGDGQGEFRRARLTSLRNMPEQIHNASCITVGDVDGDGDNDVFIAGYKPAYYNGTMPEPFFDANNGYPSSLMLNDGQGRFTDGTDAAGLAPKRFRRTYSASFVDLDNDLDLDLLVVSDFSGLDLYLNNGKGKFTDVTAQLGEDRFSFGMSHSLADFNGDGNLDIYMVGMGSTTARRLEGMKLRRQGFESIQDARMKMGYGNRLFLGDGKGGYQQAPYNDRVARSGWSWGSTPWDFDNDGDRDLFVANGHLSGKSCQDYCRHFWTKDIFHQARKKNYALANVFQNSLKGLNNSEISWNGYEHNVLFMNEGGGKYQNIAFLMGVSHESDCRSVVAGDLDQDGRPDLLVVEGRKRGDDRERQGYIQVIRNRLQTGNHWLGVHLNLAGSNVSPFGAMVTVIQKNRRQTLPIVAGDSYKAQRPFSVLFGLGKSKTAEALEVRWPNGKISRVKNPAIDKYHVIKP